MSDTYRTGMEDELDDDDKKVMQGGLEEEPVEQVVEEPAAAEPKVEEPVSEKPAEVNAGEEDDDAEDVVEMGEGVNKGRFIRHGAFHRERTMRKAHEAKVAELLERVNRESIERARIDERLNLLVQAGQAQFQPQEGQEQPKVPNPEEDPFAYMRYLEGRLNSIGENQQGVVQRIEEQDQYGSAKTAFMQDAAQFAQQKTDFMAAYKHLMSSRDRELQRIGRTDPRERQQIIQQEEYMIVSEALRNQRSPSELFYALAEDRGYRKAEAAPAAAPAPQARPNAVEQVKAAAAGQVTAKSLSAASGGAAPAVTAQSLAAMSDAEFEEVYSKMSREQRRQYFGG